MSLQTDGRHCYVKTVVEVEDVKCAGSFSRSVACGVVYCVAADTSNFIDGDLSHYQLIVSSLTFLV